jgi:RHS repeat-associated protein
MAGAYVGNPISPASAEKVEFQTDWTDSGPNPLSFTRTYRSNWMGGRAGPASGLGRTWNHNFNTGLTASPSTEPLAITVSLPEGYLRTFTRLSINSPWTPAEGNGADTLTQSGGIYSWHRADDDSTYNFTDAGKLQTVVGRNGWTTAYAYNLAGQVASVTNSFGRVLALAYVSGKLASITTPDLRVISYSYDGTGRLTRVIYPDGKSRAFTYEHASFPQTLTGITDELGVRWAMFDYDAQARATFTQLAGGVNTYRVSYPSASSVTVTDPLTTARGYGYSTSGSKLAVTSSWSPSGERNADAASRVQDASGLITGETDFNGVQSTTTWDSTRRLRTSVTEAIGKPEARTTTTQWHPTFSLPTLVAEPGRSTAYIYDSVGNLLSRAVTDNSASPAATRTWSWTYNAQQLIATATEPNGAVTSYTYDSLGNLLTSTNALNHATAYTYDSANRMASRTEPNGLVTTYTWDLRDRLLSQVVSGGGASLATTLTYNPTGTLATITLPTGLVISYSYDAAHRLIGWSNNRGESGSYTLDRMGNRTAEEIKNGAGTVAWQVVRSVNHLNRLSSQTEGSNQTNSFGYDGNNDRVMNTNGLSQSTRYGLDALRRLSTLTDAANAKASLMRNGLDDVIQAQDFKGVATTYARDALGNASAESSADVGSRSTQYDNLGLSNQITDALGQATTITRDALGRPTQLSFADGKSTILSWDSASAGKGYLAGFTDRSGSTNYTRDAFGRVTAKTQSLASGVSQSVAYSYGSNGLLAGITYPGGGQLTYQYDATGRISQLNWNGSPLITGFTWSPLGQPTGWTWAFVSSTPALTASRSYDTAARMTATEFSSYVWDAAGRVTSLTQQLYQPADTNPKRTTIATVSTTWSVNYDPTGRITGFDRSGTALTTLPSASSYAYDTNGNRSSSSRTVNGIATNRTYTLNANRPTGFSQTVGSTTSTSVSYSYDGNGALIGDGLRSYSYNAEDHLSGATTGATDTSPTTRYAYNALGQRVFKTEPQYPPVQGDESDPGFFASLVAFFKRVWSAPVTDSEKLGYGYVYDEEGTLLAEAGTGGANSGGSAKYIWLPTAGGPMPLVVIVNNTDFYAVHADHQNTPRRLTDVSGKAVWQWAYSAFGEEKPTQAKYRFANLDMTPNPGTTSAPAIKFNLRYPGQYFDEESELHYNYFRSYDPKTDTYTQNDPIGLAGGPNRRVYAMANPLKYVDRFGLAIGDFPPPPPGYDSGSWTRGAWPNNGKTYLRDPSGNTWTIHPEDKGHWRHWDKQDSDGDDDGTWPPNGKKPWPGQKKLKDGQCETDPSGDAEPWDPAKYDYTPDSPQLWIPQWANPRSPITPRYSPSPRFIPRFVLP